MSDRSSESSSDASATYVRRILSVMPSVQIETHGCKLNTADSQEMSAAFLRSGFTMWDGCSGDPDVFVLNSCTVTHVADKKARQSISSARRRHPSALTVLTGCYPQRAAEETAALNGVDLVVGNRDKGEIVKRVTERIGTGATPCSDGGAYVSRAALMGRTRASVKIQEGCDQVCAYCIVPKVRGRERSVPAEEIVRRVRNLEGAGCREVVFTGTQLGHYGFDLAGDSRHNLAGMLRSVLQETGIERIRVSSLQPLEIDESLLQLWIDEGVDRMCPHFHMPLQSGSDTVLKRMRRTYSSADFLNKVELVRSAMPDAGITTDVITGFPGESETDHQASLELMEEVAFSAAHVFPYSARPGTSAFLFADQVPPETKTERAGELREIGDHSAAAFRKSQLGTVRSVLWEGRRGVSGLTENYMRVRMDRSMPDERDGFIEDVRLLDVKRDGVIVVEAA